MFGLKSSVFSHESIDNTFVVVLIIFRSFFAIFPLKLTLNFSLLAVPTFDTGITGHEFVVLALIAAEVIPIATIARLSADRVDIDMHVLNLGDAFPLSIVSIGDSFELDLLN